MKENWLQAIDDALFCVQEVDSIRPESCYQAYDGLDHCVIEFGRMAEYDSKPMRS
jgi:hypothetical protein